MESILKLRDSEFSIFYANGVSIYNQGTVYYDLYALRSHNIGRLYGPEIVGDIWWDQMRHFNIEPTGAIIEVYSAFGGIGIYKRKVFETFHLYDYLYNQEVKTVYANCIIKYGDKNEGKLNLSGIGNSRYTEPVTCEHVCFNFKAFNLGYKIGIDSKLMYIRP